MKLFRALTAILTVCACAWVGILFAQCEEQDDNIKPLCQEINRLRDIVMAYEDYYKATEEFLDTLENHFNWVDGFDPMNYYDAVEQLHNREINVKRTYSWDVAGQMSDVIRAHIDHGCKDIREDVLIHLKDTTLLDKYHYSY